MEQLNIIPPKDNSIIYPLTNQSSTPSENVPLNEIFKSNNNCCCSVKIIKNDLNTFSII